MPQLFLSHASRDTAQAVALNAWLEREGWGDVFLDVDLRDGIAPGERWEQALTRAAERCEAVLFLVSRAWLASEWCLREFNLAFRLNKRLFGILVEDVPKDELPVNLSSTWQFVTLAGGAEDELFHVELPVTGVAAVIRFSAEGLARLRTGLCRAGLDPTTFAWPPPGDEARAPYPGLRPLEAEDAGIFFGREAATVEALERLRGLIDRPGPRLFAILGASGAGKSSFLRAGLWPRLERDDRHFLPLPVLRPERAAITGRSGLLAVLEGAVLDGALQAGGQRPDRAGIARAVAGGAPTLRPLLRSLVARASARLVDQEDGGPSRLPLLVLPIDQAEELFTPSSGPEGAHLRAVLRDLLTDDSVPLAIVVTLRSDALEAMQLSAALEGIQPSTLTLGPMPRGHFATLIEEPARRMGEAGRPVEVEPALVRALLADLEGGGSRDALPLLAFTLERLWQQEGASDRLTLAGFEALGGVRGSIEAAVERALRAADGDGRIPRDRAARFVLLRRGLVPWLAGIDPDTGTARRRVARRAEIPPEARALLDLMVEERLLTADTDPASGEPTLEPAHEALLRQWEVLQGWLEEDSAALAGLEALRRAARDWNANARHPAWLAHGGSRLDEAVAVLFRLDVQARLGEAERAYLAACRARADREAAILASRQRQRRRLQAGSLAAAIVFAVVAGFAVLQWRDAATQRAEAERQAAAATRQGALAERTLASAKGAADGLIFDLAQGLRGRGLPITVVRDVLTRAETLMARLMEGQPDDPALLRSRAAMLTAFAATYESVGDTERQRAAAEAAVPIFRRLLSGAPASVEAERDLAIALKGLSVVLVIAGEVDRAATAAAEALALMRHVHASDPAQLRNAYDLSSSLHQSARVSFAAGALEEAARHLDEALTLNQSWADRLPGEAGLQRNISAILGKIGDVRLERGDAAGALAAYREALPIGKRLSEADPDDAELARNHALQHASLGEALLAQGREDEALRAHEDGLAILRRISRQDPANARFNRDVSVGLDRIGSIREGRRDLDGALALYEESLAIRLRLFAADPANAGIARDLSVSWIAVGGIRLARGEAGGAQAAYEAALAIRRRLHDDAPNRHEAATDLMAILVRLAELRVRAGERDAALALYLTGVDVGRRERARRPNAVDGARTLALLLFRAGELQVARSDLPAAFASLDECLATLMRAGIDLRASARIGPDGASLGAALGDLAYKALPARLFPLALRASNRAIEAAPDLLWVRINNAHALMMLGRREEARADYLRHRGRPVGGERWEDVVLGDFADLRAAGLADPLMDEVETLFRSREP